MSITLVPLDENNWEECAKLEVAENQRDNLPSNIESMNKLQSYPRSKGFVIMHDDKIVGFTTFGIQEGEEIAKIFNLMIDRRHQGKGYGRVALRLVIEKMFRELNTDEVNVCYNPLKAELKQFYESFGFEDKEILPSDKPQGKMWAVLKRKNFK